MADEKPDQSKSEEETKKDTVRINLPPGLGGRGATSPPPSAPPTPKVKPEPKESTTEDEAKKATAVMGKPVETPKPKKDTARVHVPSAKPSVPEMPKPTVKLRREAEAAPGESDAEATPTAMAPAVGVQPAAASGVDAGLALISIVLSLAVLVYLVTLA